MKDDGNKNSDEISFEANDGAEGSSDAAALAAKLEKTRKELKACQVEKGEYLAGWQRAKADYLNLKKDEEERRLASSQYAKADVLNDLIRLADSFAMAFANKAAWESVPENWRQGVEYIHSQLLIVFRDHGLEEIDPLGLPFDPARDESIGTIETENNDDEGRVLEVLKKGYRLNGRILRAAQVKVGQLFKLSA